MIKLVQRPWRILLLLVGLGMMYFAFRFLWDPVHAWILRDRFRRKAVGATGTVVGHHVEYHDSDGTPTPVYFSIVEFTTRDGTAARGQSIQGHGPASQRVGNPVTLCYDPEDPSKIDIIGDRSGAVTVTFAYSCSMLMSVPMFLFGLLLLLAALFD